MRVAMDYQPWSDLGMAIVIQAVEDWRDAHRRLGKKPDDVEVDKLFKDAEKFLHTQDCELYSGLEGWRILNKLKQNPDIKKARGRHGGKTSTR